MILYLPNSISPLVLSSYSKSKIIGFFGTDSHKKNYFSFFSFLNNYQLSLEFHIYGTNNAYFSYISSSFPNLNIKLIDSNEVSISDFLTNVSCVVSVATNEGFARPIALSITVGLPIYLIRDPVFEEFYSSSVCISDSYYSLLSCLINFSPISDPYCHISFTSTYNSIISSRKSTISLVKDLISS